VIVVVIVIQHRQVARRMIVIVIVMVIVTVIVLVLVIVMVIVRVIVMVIVIVLALVLQCLQAARKGLTPQTLNPKRRPAYGAGRVAIGRDQILCAAVMEEVRAHPLIRSKSQAS
jgi:hypothetical protein